MSRWIPCRPTESRRRRAGWFTPGLAMLLATLASMGNPNRAEGLEQDSSGTSQLSASTDGSPATSAADSTTAADSTAAPDSTTAPVTSVGMTGRLEQLVLPGTRLQAKPLADDTPMVVRIAEVNPHGELMRYTIEYWGMEPGRYDLGDFVQREDGSTTDDLPRIPVEIESVMVVDNGHLNTLEKTAVPWIGGYRMLLILGGILWLLGSCAIFLLWRKPKPKPITGKESGPPLTWADKLLPLLEKSKQGHLSPAEQASVERLLVAFWRDRLKLNQLPAAEALQRIKEDEQAGQLLNQLENWLHSPNPDHSVDLPQLLKPYQEQWSVAQ